MFVGFAAAYSGLVMCYRKSDTACYRCKTLFHSTSRSGLPHLQDRDGAHQVPDHLDRYR